MQNRRIECLHFISKSTIQNIFLKYVSRNIMNIYFTLLFKTSLILIRDIPFGYLIMIPVSTMSIKLFSPFLVSFNLVLPSVISVRGLIRRHL